MKKSEKAIKIAEMITMKGISSECFGKFIKNMKPKKEEANAILNIYIKRSVCAKRSNDSTKVRT